MICMLFKSVFIKISQRLPDIGCRTSAINIWLCACIHENHSGDDHFSVPAEQFHWVGQVRGPEGCDTTASSVESDLSKQLDILTGEQNMMMAGTDNNGFHVLSPYCRQAPCFSQRTLFCSHTPYNISTVICLFYKEVEREVKWLVQDHIINRQS